MDKCCICKKETKGIVTDLIFGRIPCCLTCYESSDADKLRDSYIGDEEVADEDMSSFKS